MSKEQNRRGKISHADRATNCVMVRFYPTEFAEFLKMYEESGVPNRAKFIKARVFNETFRIIKINKTSLDYYTKLSSLHAQYRAVGVNYNQIVKELKARYSEKKALTMLYKLEKLTIELVKITQEAIELTHQFQQQWSQE